MFHLKTSCLSVITVDHKTQYCNPLITPDNPKFPLPFRFFAKYFEHPEPVLYEIVMSRHHQQILEMEKIEWEKKVIELMRERQDYKAW